MPTAANIRGITTRFIDQIAAAIDSNVRARITAAFGRVFSGVSGKSLRSSSKAAGQRPERRSLSPAARRARKLQGQYIGALRSLTGRDRDKVKAIAKTDGVAAAVRMARGIRKS